MARIKINELPAIAQVVTTTEFAADDIGQTGQTTKVTGQQLQDFISVGAGNISIVGTPVADQVMVWASAASAEGDAGFTWNGTTLAITGNITVTGTVDGVDVSTIISATEANVVTALNGATLTDVGTPAATDRILLQDASDSNNLKYADFSEFGGGGGGLNNIVEDTTPQLGGNLDANAFNIDFDDNTGIRDSNGNEQLIFQLTASAVNHIEITNAATANDPIIAAAGADTNVDLTLQAKGSGVVQVGTEVIITESAVQQISNKNIDNATLEGVINAGTATSFEIPNGAAPVVDAAGEIAVDTTITDYTGMIKYHDGTEELTVLAVPTANLTTTNGQVAAYNATNNELEFITPAGGGNVSNTGTPVDNQLAIWTGATTIEGDASLTFDTTSDTLSIGASGNLAFGAVTVIDDNAGTTTLQNIDAVDATTEATIEAAIDTLTSVTLAGSTGTGVHDFGGATSFEVPNSAAPTVDAAGEIAVDTTITDHTGLITYHDGTEALYAVGLPVGNLSTTDGQVISYNATNNEFEMSTPAGGGNVSNTGTPVDGQLAVWTSATVIEGDSALTFDTTSDTLVISDANFSFGVPTAGQPRITFDTGDFIRYIRSTNTLQLSFAAAGEFEWTATEFRPAVDSANALGTTSLRWSATWTDDLTAGGVVDFGDATSVEIPNGAAPTVDAAGEIAVDTTITDYTGMIKYHDGTEELTVLAVPTANLSTTGGQIVAYNATNNELEFVTAAGGGNVSNTGTPVDNQIAVWTNATTVEGTSELTWNGFDLNVRVASNDANPFFNLGAAGTNEFSIQTQYESASQVVDFVQISTTTSSATADSGRMVFAPDDVDKLTIRDSGLFIDGTIDLGNTSDTTIARSAAGEVTIEGNVVQTAGVQTIWVPANSMVAPTTSGAADGSVELATNDVMLETFDFDGAADEFVQFSIAFPNSYNLGTVTFIPYWTVDAAVTTGVAWALQALAIADNEAIDSAWGTAVVVTDNAQSAANELLVGAESTGVTTSAADGDLTYFRLFRDVSDAADTTTQDAKLIGIKLMYTTDAANDA